MYFRWKSHSEVSKCILKIKNSEIIEESFYDLKKDLSIQTNSIQTMQEKYN